MSAQNREKLIPPLSALAQPSCPCRDTINIKINEVFFTKKADICIWRTPLLSAKCLHWTSHTHWLQTSSMNSFFLKT